MDASTKERPVTPRSLGSLVAEGKTKKIYLTKGSNDLVTVVAKDDITAGDGAKHDVIPDKGRLATATTSNVFRLLKACGIPVAFVEQIDGITFSAPKCEMLPYEVVARREAHGSYLKRNPHLTKGQLFPKLIVEFYLKTKDKNWKGKPLVADDPFMRYEDGGKQIELLNPAKPLPGQEPFLILQPSEVFSHADEWKMFPEMRRIVRQTFLALEKAWQLEGGTLVDLKVEFGRLWNDEEMRIVLADEISPDCCRLRDLKTNEIFDKDRFRRDLGNVEEAYREVARRLGILPEGGPQDLKGPKTLQ